MLVCVYRTIVMLAIQLQKVFKLIYYNLSKNMKKTIYVTVALLTLVAFLTIIRLFLPETSVDEGTSTNFPDTSNENFVNQEDMTLTLQTRDDSLVVRNFLNDSRTIADTVNKGYYQLGNFVDPTVDAPADVSYNITYIADTQYFIITLYEEPLADSRKQAEEFLLQYLGVNEQKLCQLKYMVSVPNRVSTNFAGMDLGFSFCPGAVALE